VAIGRTASARGVDRPAWSRVRYGRSRKL